jgi:hypothetical protein
MKKTRSKSLAQMARALGFSYQRVLRSHGKGILKKINGQGYDNETSRRAIESLAAQRMMGNAPDPILLKWSRRKKWRSAEIRERVEGERRAENVAT